jgi:uncharacterized protein (TIGR03032 family)
MSEPPHPFDLKYTPNIPELIYKLGCTLIVSTYQAGKVIFISAVDNEKLIQLPKTFHYAMAVGVDGDKMAVAAHQEVLVLGNAPTLAEQYPKQPETYDNLFVPRASFYSGYLDIHGLYWSGEKLHAVNTLFSCLCIIDENYSFTPVWRPSFISALTPQDRCHLNGVAEQDGEAVYVTAFGTGDEAQSWRKTIPDGGVIIHVPTGEMVATELQMPHTPRLYYGKLYAMLSATGELICVDPDTGTYDVVKKFDGFIRGMAEYKEYLFIGYSKIRKNSSFFKNLDIAEKAQASGVMVMHLPTGALVGKLEYRSSVDEIFDIQVLSGLKRPGILNIDDNTYKLALVTPETTYWGKQSEAQ